MGPLFVLVTLSIVLFPVGVVVGFILSFLAVPIFHRVRNTPKEDRRIGIPRRLRVSAAFAFVFMVAVLGIGLCDSYKDVNDYWRYEGAFDFFRMPLEEPYELVMIDALDEAHIGKWRESGTLIGGIVRYERRASFLIGETSGEAFADRDSPPTGWFIFDLASGRLYEYRSFHELREGAARHGIQPPFDFQSIKDNWDHYWANPRTPDKWSHPPVAASRAGLAMRPDANPRIYKAAGPPKF
jgi:hypothetical protein